MNEPIQCIECDAVIGACGELPKTYGAIGPLCECCHAVHVRFEGENHE